MKLSTKKIIAREGLLFIGGILAMVVVIAVFRFFPNVFEATADKIYLELIPILLIFMICIYPIYIIARFILLFDFFIRWLLRL